MIEPKTCPFCGMKIMNICNRGGVLPFAIECGKCSAMTMYFSTKEEAVAAWNNRKPVDDVLERLEEYRDDFMDAIYDELQEDTDNLRANRIIDRFDEAIEIIKEGLK